MIKLIEAGSRLVVVCGSRPSQAKRIVASSILWTVPCEFPASSPLQHCLGWTREKWISMVITFYTFRFPGVKKETSLVSIDETTESLRERASAVIARDTESDVPRPKSVTYIDYENPFSMVSEASSGAAHVATLSKYAWVGCGGDVYVLDLMGKGHVRIEPQEMPEGILTYCLYSIPASWPSAGKHFEGHFTPATPDKVTRSSFSLSPFMRSRKVLSAKTLDDALRGCDTYISSKIAKGPMLSVGYVLSLCMRPHI